MCYADSAPGSPRRRPPCRARWTRSRQLAPSRLRYVFRCHPCRRASVGTVQDGAAVPQSRAGAALADQPTVPTTPRQGQGSADIGTRIVHVLSPNSPLASTICVYTSRLNPAVFGVNSTLGIRRKGLSAGSGSFGKEIQNGADAPTAQFGQEGALVDGACLALLMSRPTSGIRESSPLPIIPLVAVKPQYRSDSAKHPGGLLGGASGLRPTTVSSALDVELGHLAFDDAGVGAE